VTLGAGGGRAASPARAPDRVGGCLALFPGMAAAFPGMGRPLAGRPAAARVFAEFGRWSRLDVAGAAAKATAEELFRDRTWELAVVATQAAALAAWQEAGNAVAASLGFSIGAYAALLSAGALSVEQAVAIIDVVLEASRRLPGRYAMAALTGTAPDTVAPLLQPGRTDVAAVVAPGQLLIAGTEADVRALAETLTPEALGVRVLAVRWPLHTPLMLPVAEELERRRDRLGGLRPFRHPVYSALHGGRIETPEEGWRLLVDHLYRPQRFDLAFAAARSDGLRRCVELGPAGALKRAVRWLARDEVAVEAFPGGAPPARGDRS